MAQSQSPTPESNNSPSDNADSIITASSEEASVEQEREALKKARDADAPDSADGEGAAAHGNLHFGEEDQGELKKYEDTPDDAVPSEVGAPDPSHGQQNAGSGDDGSDNEIVTSTDEEEKTADPANAEGGVPSPSADTSYATSSSSLGDEPVESTSSAKTTSGDEEPTGAGVERTPASETPNESPTDLDLSDTSVDENDAGAVVATLTTSDADSNDTATYSIVEDPSGFFEVVGNELRLRDGVSLDHEAQNAYEIVLQVEDSAGNVYTETVTIDVNDVNEGPSGVSLSNTTIDENDAGAVVGTVSAVDPDDGDSLTYTVSDDRFEIVGNELRLKDGVSLDHEAAETIDVTVTATDQGGLESSQAFTINVDDVNEGPSGVSLSNTTIDENDAGAVVGTVSAVDPDDGDSLTYTVSDDRFEIVGNELRLKDGVSLDHEAAETIDVTVTATDQGGLESSQAFTINVDDVNEGPSGVSLSNTTIDENDAGAVVGTVSAVDPDDGDSLTYTVSDDRFEIVGNELRLKDGVSLDHEAAETIDVTVTATDQGGLESSQAFTINVDDVNEGPTGVSLSNTTIDENDAGAVVGTVSAVDPDDGDSLTYTVSDDRFEIVGNELRLKDGVSLDHEAAETIDVTVTATDQGGLESSEAFTINVDDVNEGPTGVSLSNTTIDENDAGAVVGTVSAVDPDDGDSLTYTVSDDRFEIVGNELRLKDGVSLDHEAAETIDVTVTATDQGGLESSQAFTINVDDVNEGPTGVSLSNTTIDENDAGAVIGTVSAVDPDDGDSLTYTVSDDRFEIVGNELRLKDGVSLDHETAETIDVTVTATDQGGLESSEAFTINVDDVNEGPTGVSLSNTTIDENDAGAVVGTVSAVDPDDGDSLTYTVSDDRFEIVGNELRLKDGVSLDHEAAETIDVTVTATDQGGLESSQAFTINVDDVNEGPSGVSLSNTTIDENDAGAVVGTVSAVDPDDGDSLTYTVSDDRFEIVGNELRLKDGVSLDHETAETIDVTVTATDQGGLESSQAFTINVDDVNEGPTGVSLSNTTIDENDAGAVVGTVSAVDPDAGDSLTYTVSDDRFEIVGNELRLKDGVSLDHEAAETIDVTVTATDQGGLESSEAFTINVDDVNEGPSGVSLSSDRDVVQEDAAVSGAEMSTSNGGGTNTATLDLSADNADSAAVTINFEYLDNSFEIVVNGQSLTGGTIQLQSNIYDPATESFLQFEDGSAIHQPWVPNEDGSPRIQVVITEDGVQVFATRTPTSGVMEPMELTNGDFNLPDFIAGENSIEVINPDQDGPDGISASISATHDGTDFIVGESETGAVVGTVSAVDPDDGDSLTYTVSDDRFEIVGNELRLKDGVSLDHEAAETIDVTVTATDQGGLESSQAFTINVDDVNEGPTGVSLSNTTIDENDAGAVVGTVSAVDPDDGDSLTYTVSDDRFEIVGNELRLKDGVSLDHETAETIDVTVTATDQGGLESSQAFTINVDDVNEGPSGVSLSNTTIDENDAGAVVGTVSAVDPDAGDSLTYTVSDDRFEIVGNELRLKDGVSLDHEAAETIDVTVTATDQGGLESSEAFTINVDDVNEGPSGVSLSSDRDVVQEDAAVSGAEMSTSNGGGTNTATLDLSADNADSAAVTINFEYLDNSFEIVVNGQSLTGGTIQLQSNIYDPATESFLQFEDGSAIHQPWVPNEDGSPRIQVVITEDGVQVFATRTPTSGVMEPMELTNGDFNLPDFIAGENSIEVINPDQDGPDGISASISATHDGTDFIVGESETGAVVGTVSAVDPDDGDSLTYTVSDDRFEIVGNELRLKDGVSLDHEAAETIDVTVTATDQGGLESSQAFTINVDDVNEGPTGVSLSNTTIDENDAGAVVGTVSAVDPDDGDSLTYTVSDDRFEIVGNELRLKDGVSLDHETAETIDVTVTATDQGGLESSQAFTINVDDVNEGPSGVSLSNTTIDENDAGAVVGTLSSSDPDAGDTAAYSIADDTSGLFEIVGNELKLKDDASLDYETQGTYEVTIQVTDSAGASHWETMTINVADVAETNVILGTNGGDSVSGDDNADEIVGRGGNDRINGRGGDDIISGDGGRDNIRGGDGDDTLSGGAGRDNVRGDDGDDALDGGSGNDTLRGGDDDDVIDGGNGNDVIRGDDGADELRGGAGNDTIYADADDTVVEGGDGRDRVIVQGDDDFTIDMTANGVERVDGGDGNDTMDATGMTDRITQFGDDGSDTLIGGENRDNQQGGEGNDTISGNGGNDRIRGGDGDDTLAGGEGRDNMRGDAGDDLIDGNEGDDRLQGGDGEDTLSGGEGRDNISGDEGNDLIYGDDGNDRIQGGAGDDAIYAGADDDRVRGGDGDDTLSGGEGRDNLRGDAGDDVIYGNEGNDILRGEDGSDVFVYEMGDGSDKIYGGSGGGWTDVIQLSDGETSLGEYGVDWTLEVTDGSIISVDEDGIKLSDDADGIITLSDGSTIEFSDIEEIVI